MPVRTGQRNASRTATEEWSFETLRRVRWPDGPVCPWCKGRRVTRHTNVARSPRRRYLCLGCRRTFTDLTGTPLTRTNLPLATWFDCIRMVHRARKTSDLARILGVKWETAERMRRCLLAASLQPGLIRSLTKLLAAESTGEHDR